MLEKNEFNYCDKHKQWKVWRKDKKGKYCKECGRIATLPRK